MNGQLADSVWAPMNAYPTPLSKEHYFFVQRDILKYGHIYNQEADRKTSDAGEEVRFFRRHLTLSGQAVPISQGRTGGKIELKTKYNSILLYFNLSII